VARLAESCYRDHAERADVISGRGLLAEFKNKEELEAWLLRQPRNVSVAFAARMALRVLPVVQTERLLSARRFYARPWSPRHGMTSHRQAAKQNVPPCPTIETRKTPSRD
jgi:hypothetical protein